MFFDGLGQEGTNGPSVEIYRQREIIQLKVKCIDKKLMFRAGLKLGLFRMTKDWW